MNRNKLKIILIAIILITLVLIVSVIFITPSVKKNNVPKSGDSNTSDYSFEIISKDYDITITDKDALLKMLKEDFRLFDATKNRRVKIIVNRIVQAEDPKNKVTHYDITDRKNNSAYTLEFNIPYFYLEYNTTTERKLKSESLQDIIFSNLPSSASKRSPELSKKILMQGKIFFTLKQKV